MFLSQIQYGFEFQIPMDSTLNAKIIFSAKHKTTSCKLRIPIQNPRKTDLQLGVSQGDITAKITGQPLPYNAHKTQVSLSYSHKHSFASIRGSCTCTLSTQLKDPLRNFCIELFAKALFSQGSTAAVTLLNYYPF